MSRSASSNSRTNEGGAGRRSRSKNPDSDAGGSAPNPDPAFFEAAFVIDDGDEPSRAGTPKPPLPPEKDTPNGESTGDAEAAQKSNPGGDGKEGSSREGHAAGEGAAHTTKPVLTLELKQKLRKLEKLEATYPGMSSLILNDRYSQKERAKEAKELTALCHRTFTILPGCASSCYCHRAFRESASRKYTSGHYW